MLIRASDLVNAIENVIDKNDEILVIHSSLMHLKFTQDMKWVVLSALKTLVKKGYTVAIPCFTFSFTKTKYFDPDHSSSEVGVLGDWFRELNDVKRTHHPIYSFSISGPLANEISQVSTENCFSKDSIFDYFHKKQTRIILLGCDFKYITQFHYYEELENVPYRYQKKMSGKINFNDQYAEISTNMFVRDLKINPINEFSDAIKRLEKQTLIKKYSLSDSELIGIKEHDLYKESLKILKKNKLGFIKNKDSVRYKLQRQSIKKSNLPLKISLIGNSNLSLLEESIKTQLSIYFDHREIEVYTPEYGQGFKEVVNENSNLIKFNPDYVYFIDTLEDIFQVDSIDDIQKENESLFSTYLEIIKLCSQRLASRIFVNSLLYLKKSIYRNYFYAEKEGRLSFLQDCNKKLQELSKKISKIDMIYSEDVIALCAGDIYDSRLWYVGKFRFTKSYYDALAEKLAGCLLACTGATIRLIAVDLDQTLWGGVLGEDGVEGIQIGGDYPGNSFKEFQRALLHLNQRGIVLAILSKNDEDLALKTIDHHPDMLIRSKHLAAYYINWREKSDNLIDLSNNLRLGLENILFIDDKPLEREKIRLNLPEVKILDLPADPAKYTETLLRSPYIECLTLTNEDKNRAVSYHKISDSRKQNVSSIKEFFNAQNIKIFINTIDKNNNARAVQLIHKTNQFNATTKRYSESELEQLKKHSHEIFVVGMSDILTEFENIGLFILNHEDKKTLTIDSFLLSCRVLGKGIESAMLSWISQYAKKMKYENIIGEIKITPRNNPVRAVYREHGFILSTQNENLSTWLLNVNEQLIYNPSWLQLIDGGTEKKYA